MNGDVCPHTHYVVITIIHANIYFKINEYSYINQVQNKTSIPKVSYQMVYKKNINVIITYYITNILLMS